MLVHANELVLSFIAVTPEFCRATSQQRVSNEFLGLVCFSCTFLYFIPSECIFALLDGEEKKKNRDVESTNETVFFIAKRKV